MKILVIEDDAVVRKFIIATLETERHTVFEACNGKEGLLFLKEHSGISIIITDIVMPEKEGIETIMEVKRYYPAIKIIAISGGGKNSPENYLILAKALGAHVTLKKPFNVNDLLMSLQSSD
ncbi:MAG: response regulator [Chlorobium sp.]|jgi:CheY-like chemotaxis protein|nr:response regulator [Chlorobium sp.]